MSDAKHSLERDRIQALVELKEHHHDVWQSLNEKHDVEENDLRTSLNVHESDESQRELLAQTQYDELQALLAMHHSQFCLVSDSKNPLKTANEIILEDEKKYEQLEPAYTLDPLGLSQPSFTQQYHRPYDAELPESPHHHAETSELGASLDRAKFDLSQDKEKTHFDDVEGLKNISKQDFNQVANPFDNENEYTIER